MKNKVVKYVFLASGGVLIGLGIMICEKTGLGADPITVLYSGISKSLGVSLGTASYIAAIIAIMLAFLIDKKQLGLGTLVTPVFTKIGMSILDEVSFNFTGFMNYVVFFVGLITLGFGIALVVRQNLGKGSNDALIMSISNKYKIDYSKVRWGVDGLYLIIGYLLGGRITVGTVIAIVSLGKIIEFFINFQLMRKTVNCED